MAETLTSGPLSSGNDDRRKPKIVLLIIDPQNDFHSNNAVAVPGAVEDSIRIQNMIRQVWTTVFFRSIHYRY
jgi:nicotinamidase-related amidase